jgi:ribosomal protein S18 acetylase RimI-like enzyme
LNLTVGPARADERAEAFRLYFQQTPEAERGGRVDRGLEMIASGEVAPDGVIVCRPGQGQPIVGVMVVLALPGAAGLAWPPQALAGDQRRLVEGRLVAFTCAWLRQRGCKFVQALLPPQDNEPAATLQRHGFRHITTLVYLDKTLELEADVAAPRLTYQLFPAADAACFQQTLLRSYRDTLDCPELNEIRTAEEVIAGYRAVPGCRLDRWWLAWQGDQPVGVLLAVETPEQKAWELLYVGLVPEARRRGLGTEMTRKALHEAQTAGAARMTLTVDQRNGPAQRMYAALGFEEFDRREVYLKVLA